MAKRKNWKYTRNGVEYTLSEGGLMDVFGGGWQICDGISEWCGEPWKETVTILGFSKAEGKTFKQGCTVRYLDTDGKIHEQIIDSGGAGPRW